MSAPTDRPTYDALSDEQKAVVNDRIIEEFRNNPGELAKYNLAIKAEFESGGVSKEDKMNAFQEVLDGRREELAKKLQAGEGGFASYDAIAANTGNGPKTNLTNSQNILREIGGQLAAYDPSLNEEQFTTKNLDSIVRAARGRHDFYSSVTQIMSEGVCVAPTDSAGNLSLPARGQDCSHER